MGNRRAREFVKSQEMEARWHRIMTEPRTAISNLRAPRIGALRLQLIVCPSFEDAKGWEIHQIDQDWRLFRSSVHRTLDHDIQLVGYEELKFSSNELVRYFTRLMSLSMPLAPDLSQTIGCDGTTYQLAVFGDRSSSWKFRWWSDPPEQWRALGQITDEMIAAFSSAV